jgi:hypothetical protein
MRNMHVRKKPLTEKMSHAGSVEDECKKQQQRRGEYCSEDSAERACSCV